jgi:hypothetical protein
MQQIPFTDLFNQPYMFRATSSPILRSTFDCIYNSWYNAPTLLPTGDTAEMELVRQQYRCIVPKAVYAVKNAPEDGRICRPKHAGPIKKINKRNLLHLVGCLHHSVSIV